MKLSIALSSLLLASGTSTTITSSHDSFLERSASIGSINRFDGMHSVFKSENFHWLSYFEIS